MMYTQFVPLVVSYIMKSKWFELKPDAIKMRQRGLSLRTIENRLKIPRSTLSGWFIQVNMPESKKAILLKRSRDSLVKARKKAILWHHEQKNLRRKMASSQALSVLKTINHNNKTLIELALSFLYLGEGNKGNYMALANSDPLIVLFYIKCMSILYNISPSTIRCNLHLRNDQDEMVVKKFWSSKLDLSLTSFSVNKDKRVLRKPTRKEYMGVCVINCGNIAIQRKLLFLSRLFCERISQGDA